MSTIAAISTPNAVGGIAVIRISGPDALTVAERVFTPANGKPVSAMAGYTCAYGTVRDQAGNPLDDVVLTVFRAPHSYTGEDTAELSCHGGLFLSRQVLRLCFAAGAEPAGPGEFTKRAFLAGKLSLTQAESVMDLISARGDAELRCARSLREGAVFRRIHACTDRLVKLLSDLAAWADYPEEDIPSVEPENLCASLTGLHAELSAVAATYDYGRILREGINTVIVGRPNVGKSTLMNRLSGFERSIVTDVAGTTRDVVEESVRLGDLTLRLSDTAGLRDTADRVEQIGVEIAYRRLEDAELVLAVFDSTSPLQPQDQELINRIGNRRAVAVCNKSDAGALLDMQELDRHFDYVIPLSAKTGEGMDKLSAALHALFLADAPDPQAGVLSNERQKHCVMAALEQLSAAISAVRAGEPLDCVTVLLEDGANVLLELTGERATEAVVEQVFARFCVGK